METYLSTALGDDAQAADLAKRMSSEGVALSDLSDLDEDHLIDAFAMKLGPRIRLLRYVEAHPPPKPSSLSPPKPHRLIRRRSSLLVRDRKLTSAQFMHVWNYYAGDADRIEGPKVDALLNDLLRQRSAHPLSAAELEDDKKLLLESFASPDGSFELSALSVLMSVEDCFLLKFKKKNKVTSIELMKIWQHYDEDNDGTIEQIELQGLLRDLLTAAATQSEGGSGSVVSPTDVREYSEVLLDMFDTDHDGKISIGELSKILNTEKSYLEHLKGRSSLTKEQFNRVWKHYDRDGTGLISGPALRALAWDVIRGEGAEAVEVIRLNEILEREAAIIEVAEIGESQGLNKLNLTTLLGLNPELAT
eukprot:gene2405-8195_t